MVSASVKRIVVFPERHHRPRTREAITFARETAEKGASVKLFVEGMMAGDIARLSKEAGFPITCIENEKIKRPTDIAMFLTALHDLNVFRWSIANINDRDCFQFLQDAARSAYLALNPLSTDLPSEPVQVGLNAIMEHLVAECRLTSSLLKKFRIMEDTELDAVVSDSLAPGECHIPRSLLELTLRLLNCSPQSELDWMASALLPEMLRFFSGRYGICAYYAGFGDMQISKLSKRLHPGYNPLEARDMLSRLGTRLMSLRELFMAYSIAREEFDYGIVNVGQVHALSVTLCGTLSAAGMEIYEKPIPPP